MAAATSSLAGLRKAAILLVLLGEDVASQIYRNLPERELEQLTQEYRTHSVRLGCDAAERCLAAASMTASDIDMIITVSCTGFMIPSLDAHLINLMGFRSNVRRLPITELGCAAGAMR